jgi:hypothetical protein
MDATTGAAAAARRPRGKAAPDLTGRQFGRLRVVAAAGVSGGRPSRALFACACACGAAVTLPRASLTRRHGTRSCGCLRREVAGRHAASLTAARGGAHAVLVARLLARLYALAPGGAYVDELAAACGADRRRVGQAVRTLRTAGVPLVRSGDRGHHVALAASEVRRAG